jgi:DHA1 family inner membrane transport protein
MLPGRASLRKCLPAVVTEALDKPSQLRRRFRVSAQDPDTAASETRRLNAGNARGAWLGGLAISAGLGYAAQRYVGAVVVGASLAVMVAAARDARRPPASAAQVS